MEPRDNVKDYFINNAGVGDPEQFCKGKQNVLHDRHEDLRLTMQICYSGGKS